MQPRDKSRLYHDLGQLIRSGMTLASSGGKTRGTFAWARRGLLHAIGAGLAKGDTVAEAVARQPQINDLDTALFAASERAGKLDRGFDLAAEYYNALARRAGRILRKTGIPAVRRPFRRGGI
jgi:type II secretory pathway component PulF